MIYETGQFYMNGGSGDSWASCLYNFISQYYSHLTVAGNRLTFDGKFTLSFSSATYSAITLHHSDGNSTTLGTFGYFPTTELASATLIITDDVFYLKLIRTWYPTECQGAIIWLRSGDLNFVGIDARTNPIIETTYYNAEDSLKGSYSLGKAANYAVMPLKLVYSKLCPIIQTTGGDVLAINGLVSCSTISLYSSISFGGHTYYAIGTNTLIPVDEES